MLKKGAGVLHFPGLAHYAFSDEFALCINAAATSYSHTWLELKELWAELKPSSRQLSFPKNYHTKSSEIQIMQWMSWVHTCLLSSYVHWSHLDQLKCQGEPATEEDWGQTFWPQVLISAESRTLIHHKAWQCTLCWLQHRHVHIVLQEQQAKHLPMGDGAMVWGNWSPDIQRWNCKHFWQQLDTSSLALLEIFLWGMGHCLITSLTAHLELTEGGPPWPHLNWMPRFKAVWDQTSLALLTAVLAGPSSHWQRWGTTHL